MHPRTKKNILKRAAKKIELAYGRHAIIQNGFWFIDIPRTSSSSIRAVLGKRFGRVYGKKKVPGKARVRRQIFPDHMLAREMRDFLGPDIWKSLFTFTFVRNPWDRTFSMYNYRLMESSIPLEWSFRDYILALKNAPFDAEHFKFNGHYFGASEYVLGENGDIIVDFIAKYENRVHDLKLIASRLGIDEFDNISMLCASPKNRHYSEFYDTETREIVRRIYMKDIELFNYEFEDKS